MTSQLDDKEPTELEETMEEDVVHMQSLYRNPDSAPKDVVTGYQSSQKAASIETVLLCPTVHASLGSISNLETTKKIKENMFDAGAALATSVKISHYYD